MGDYIREYHRVFKGYTRSVDYGSYVDSRGFLEHATALPFSVTYYNGFHFLFHYPCVTLIYI